MLEENQIRQGIILTNQALTIEFLYSYILAPFTKFCSPLLKYLKETKEDVARKITSYI